MRISDHDGVAQAKSWHRVSSGERKKSEIGEARQSKIGGGSVSWHRRNGS